MFNLTLSPSQVELLAKPGATITQAYDITNNSDSIITLNASVRSWQPVGAEGLISYSGVLANPHFEFSLANSDIRLGQVFSIKPHQKQQLVLKIKSQNDTPLADSYFTFFVSQAANNSLNPNQIGAQTSAEIGSHLLISTSPSQSIAIKSDISKFSVSPKFKDIFLTKLTFNGLVTNKTEHYFKTDGKITISKNGLTLRELPLFPHNVLANYSRQISCLDHNESVPCTFSPPFWPGHYTATLESNQATATISFFVFPFSFTFFLGLLIIFTFLTIKITHIRNRN